jgi:hypothetical protein
MEANMIRHYCDGCGTEVTAENGVIGMKELTVEMDDKKLSIAVEIDVMKNGNQQGSPAVCARCISRRFAQWAVDVSNAPVAQSDSERLVSTQQAAGSSPAGGAN